MYNRFRLPPFLSALVLGGLCALLASSTSVGQGVTYNPPEKYLSFPEVYDYWCDMLSHQDDPLDTWCSSNDTAKELYDIQGTGISVMFVVARTNMVVDGTLSVADNVCWVGGYPVYPSDTLFPGPGDVAAYATNTSQLVFSILNRMATLPHQVVTNNSGFTASYTYTYPFTNQPHGTIHTRTRIHIENPYIGYYCAFVDHIPTVWAYQTLYAVEPEVYEEITGHDWLYPPAGIWLGDNPKIKLRALERWR